MGRLRAVLFQIRSARVVRHDLAVLIVFAMLSLCLRAQQTGQSSSLHGAVRDSQGKPVAGAIIQLQANDRTQAQTTSTDLQGNYQFAALSGGVYALRAEMTGYSNTEIPSLFLGP